MFLQVQKLTIIQNGRMLWDLEGMILTSVIMSGPV